MQAAAFAERVRVTAVVGLVAFVLLAGLAVWRGRRAAVLRLGVAVAVVAGVAAALALALPRVLFEDAAADAVLATWLHPLAAWLGAAAGAGAIAALAAAAILRPVTLLPRLWATAPRRPPSPAAVTAPRPSDAPRRCPLASPRPRRIPPPRGFSAPPCGRAPSSPSRSAPPCSSSPSPCSSSPSWRSGCCSSSPGRASCCGSPATRPRGGSGGSRAASASAPLAGALLATLGALAFAAGNDPAPVFVGRCNGSAELCDRRLDEVSLVGTHNSMSADGEPGWLFAAQDGSIEQQLEDGVRSLLIDTHYGFATPRGVATDLEHDSKSRAKIEGEVGPRFVETAQRLRARIGFTGDEPREIFLCHAFCEVGATRALEALRQVHRFLVAHPEEVLILSIEDDTEAKDTAQLLRDSGLIREVYRGPAKPPWPTLRELIERNERVLVLIENDPGDEPWMHKQSEVAQETPYHFGTAAELGADDSCRPNRGGDHRLAAARQPLGRHVTGAAHHDRARGQRPRLPERAGSPAAAPSAG